MDKAVAKAGMPTSVPGSESPTAGVSACPPGLWVGRARRSVSRGFTLLELMVVVAMIAIKTFLALIRRLDFIPFAIYRFVVAFAVYLVFVA